MKKHTSSRVLSLVLVLALLCGIAVPANAAPAEKASTTQNLNFEKVDIDSVAKTGAVEADPVEKVEYKANDVVRVSIVLEKKATLSAGFSSVNVAANTAAVSYRNSLKAEQNAVAAKIEKVTGEKLNVVWNLTLAANIISANVKFAQIAEIEKVAGVKAVEIENRYEPQTAESADEPNMGTSTFMIGSNVAWAVGYYGAGSKVAVIDTGIDTDHQSFAESGYNYAMGLNAEENEMNLDEYKASVGVLTEEFVASVADQLNVTIDAHQTYVSDKIPYAYNYVDNNYTVDHDSDTQGEHGSHVEGIAASNRYIPQADGTFAPALETVMSQGVAPDAQIVTMKVFGAGGGAYDSDYMAAIEDAIVLGCDSANLSLGSGNPGFAHSGSYQAIMDSLTSCSTVVAMSAGNSGGWYDNPQAGGVPYLYAEDISMATNGSPGSFTNSLGVASVDNTGASGMPLMFGDIVSFYTETTGYSNPPIVATIPGDNDFIFFNNTAVDGAGTDLLAPYADDIAGKVVLVYRGSSSFYQKMDAAAAAGATACIIVNNQAGTINMDLSSATSSIPCVSITQDDGEKIKAAYETTTLSDGTAVWTGSLKVTDKVQIVPGDAEFYTISSFSSWGVPGALTMKPEISAPGGSIYAVNGAEAGGKGYELMSGTSMASPQVAGMAALVGQYVRENGLTEKTGLTARQLANSLLMSTAVPMLEDFGEYGYGYYPVLRQGSGLANVGAAVSAKSYILMGTDSTASAGDGKVKVELGDDPARTGAYTWSFTVNNMSEDDVNYTLSTDIFTQDLTSDGKMLYMDTWTTMLPADVAFTVNGVEFVPTFAAEADVDMDGDTDNDDVQAILNYVVGAVTENDIDVEVADVDGDGKVTSADAYALLSKSETTSFQVAAGESAEVVVCVALGDDVKEYLDTYYTNGAYVQGYTYVTPVATAEGAAEDVEYSIPVLGFYGSWTDASMFDNTSITDVAYGTDTKVPYTGNKQTNGLYVRYGTDTTNNWFLGNPYVVEDSFPADRLAVSNDVNIYQFRYSLIRNAAAIGAAITDENGKVLWNSNPSGNTAGAYYYTNGSAWRNTNVSGLTVNKTIGSLGLEEGQKVTFGAYAIPEYYANPENGKLTSDEFKAVIESGVLGDGASISYTAAVDNTAPVLTAVTKDLLTGNITISAQDDNYVAAVMMANAAGTKILGATLPEQDAPNQVCTAEVDLGGANPGAKALVIVGDYAGNETAYLVEYSSEPVTFDGKIYGFTSSSVRGSGNRWVEITPDVLWYNTSTTNGEGLDTVSTSPVNVTAAEYVDGYIFMAVAGGIYVAPQGEWDAVQKVGKCTKTFIDMAYNTADETLYALDDANTIWSIDTTTGAQTEVAVIANVTTPVTLAIDDNGTFYTISKGATSAATLYSFTLADVIDGNVNATAANAKVGAWVYNAAATTAWDHNTGVLYLASCYNANDYDNKLWIVDPATGVGTLANPSYKGEDGSAARPSCLQAAITGLYIVPAKDAAPVISAPTSIEIDPEKVELMVGCTETVTADVYPWNLADKSVTWTSSDESVVTVDENGNLKAVAPGTATVTATTVAAPALTAECAVTVTAVPVATMKGLVYAVDGTPNWSEFSSDAPENATVLAQGDAYFGGTLVGDTLYVVTEDTIFAVDADTFAVESLGEIASDWIYADAAAVPEDLIDVFGGKVVAPCYGGTYLEVLDPVAGKLSYWSGIANYYADDPMAAIALIGKTAYTDSYGDSYDDAVEYAVITENGELWSFIIYDEGGYLYREDLGNTGLELGNVSAVTASVYASMLYDAATGMLYLANYAEGETAQLYAINPETLKVALAGEFGDGVWPAISLYQYTPVTELTVTLSASDATIYVDGTVTLTAKVKPAQYTGGVVWTSSDETVATVVDGVVTGISEGTAVITATSVDTNEQGATVSASCNITVKGAVSVNAAIGAHVVNGTTGKYVQIDLANGLTMTDDGSALVPYTAGGMSAGEQYGLYTTWLVQNSAGSYFDFANSNYIPVDVASMPAFQGHDTAFPSKVFYPSTTGSLVSLDFAGAKVSSWNTASYGWCGAAFSGVSTDEDGDNLVYYMLGANGDVTLIFVYEGANAGSMSLYPSAIGNVGRTFDPTTTSMGYYWDHEEDGVEGLIIADGATSELLWVDLTAEELSAASMGAVAADSVCGLYGSYDVFASTSDGHARVNKYNGETKAAAMGLSLDAVVAETVSLNPVNAVVGGTDSAKVSTMSKSLVRSAIGGAEAESVCVDIIVDEPATNGKYTVCFDTEVLKLHDVLSEAEFSACAADEENGTVTLAFANTEAAQAGDAIFTLIFERLSTDATEVVVATQELNDELELDVTDTVEIESAQHVCPKEFEDVSLDDWFHEAVDYVVANGIMQGTSDTKFSPEMELTRAQMVTILYRMADEPEVEYTPAFTDVKEGKWYTNAVMWAVANGVTNGTGNGKFNTNGIMTRAEMYTFLAKYAKMENKFEAADDVDLSVFDDGASVAKWATESVKWAVANGLVIVNDNKLDTKAPANRAEVAFVIMSYMQNL